MSRFEELLKQVAKEHAREVEEALRIRPSQQNGYAVEDLESGDEHLMYRMTSEDSIRLPHKVSPERAGSQGEIPARQVSFLSQEGQGVARQTGDTTPRGTTDSGGSHVISYGSRPSRETFVTVQDGCYLFSLRTGWDREQIWGTEISQSKRFYRGLSNRKSIVRTSVVLPRPSAQWCLRFFCGGGGCVLFPSSNFRTFWDIASLFLIVFDFLSLPFIFAFQPEDELTGLGLFTLAFWSLDMLQGPFLGYYHRGHYISHNGKVFMHYLRTWFVVDCLVVLPEWLLLLSGSRDDSPLAVLTGVGKFSKFLRVLRLVRLAKLRKIVDTLYDMTTNQIQFTVFGTLQLLLLVLVLNHIVACMWYALGKSAQDNGNISWLNTLGSDTSLYYLYLSSLHWSLTQFTPASVDISARSREERLFSIIVLFWAMVVFSSFVGSITASITRLRSLRADVTKQMWLLRHFLRKRGVSKNLSSRIQKYVEHQLLLQVKTVNMGEMDVLGKLTDALKAELTYDMHSPLICLHPFFEELAIELEVMVHRLCTCLTPQLCHHGQQIFQIGDEAQCMFILQYGELEYRCELCPSEYISLSANRTHGFRVVWITEAVLWTSWRNQGALIVRDDQTSEVLCLDHGAFQEILNKHPATWMFASVYGQKFVEYINSLDELSDILSEKAFYTDAVELAAQAAFCTLEEAPDVVCLSKEVDQNQADPASACLRESQERNEEDDEGPRLSKVLVL